MDITVCHARHIRLVITDQAMVAVQVATPEDAQARAASHLFGGLLGAAMADDGGSLLGGGQLSILKLGDGKPIPPLHHMRAS